jgi:cell division protease FtsH
VGKLSFYDPQQENTFTKPYSEETGKLIDDEVRSLVDDAYRRTKLLLTDRRDKVERLALALLDREVLHKDDVEEILGKRPFEEKKLFTEGEEGTTVDTVPAATSAQAGNGELHGTQAADNTPNPDSVTSTGN